MNDNVCSRTPNSDVVNIDGIDLHSQQTLGVRGVINNGIVLERKKGVVMMSLKGGLSKTVGGYNLLGNDLESFTTQLLLKEEEEDEPTVPSLSDGPSLLVEDSSENELKEHKKIHSKADSGKISVLYTISEVCNNENESQVNLEEFTDCEETLNGLSTLNYPLFDKSMEQIDEIDTFTNTSISDNIRVLNTGQSCKDTSSKKLIGKQSLIVKTNNKPVISVQKVMKNFSNQNGMNFKSKLKCKANNIGSVLVKSNSMRTKVLGNYILSGETSDNSEVSVVPAADTKLPAKRGGWPKGRKRKPEVKSEVRPPKAPATAYVIFLNERRKDFKDLAFTEVTKLLGHEWSKLSLQDKKVYLEQAEVEKKRYREELKLYRQSDSYQTYLQNKRLKRLQGNGTEESDMDATDEIDEEDNEELYCRTCDQWFHSLHNKKEHLYGRQHLQSLAGRYKTTDPDWRNPNMSSTSFDESSLDGSSYLKGSKDHCCNKNSGSLSMDDTIVRFMAANQEREEERAILKKKLEEVKAKNMALTLSLQECNRTLNSLTCMAESEKTTEILLEQRLFNLLNVPTLFYLPEPLNEENN